jgi:polyphosphate glucokinase
LENAGEKKWNKRMKKILKILKTVFNYDRLYISGGNSSRLSFRPGENIKVITNKDGIRGGAGVWQLDESLFMRSCDTVPNTLKPVYAGQEYNNAGI